MKDRDYARLGRLEIGKKSEVPFCKDKKDLFQPKKASFTTFSSNLPAKWLELGDRFRARLFSPYSRRLRHQLPFRKAPNRKVIRVTPEPVRRLESSIKALNKSL